MQQLAPNAGLSGDMPELPLSVKPEKKVSVEDVARLLGSYYEGTDMNLSGRQSQEPSKERGRRCSRAGLDCERPCQSVDAS